MSKNILIIHGFEIFDRHHPLCKALEKQGFNVYIPEYYDYSDTFNVNDVTKRIINEYKDVELEAVIGISMGGFIVSRIYNYLKSKKQIYIASSPKFEPKFPYKLLFLLPGPIIKTAITLVKRFRFLKIKTFFDKNLLDKLNSRYIYSLIRYVICENQEKNINNKLNKYAVLGEKDVLMPPINWKNVNNTELIIVEGAKHENVLNSESITKLLNIINIKHYK